MIKPSPTIPVLLYDVIRAWREILRELNDSARSAGHLPLLNGALAHGVLAEDGFLPLEQPWQDRPLRSILQRLIDGDPHLRSTCRAPLWLAQALDKILDNEIHFALVEREHVDEVVCALVISELYASPYRRRLFLRLYNVIVESPPIPVEAIPGHIIVATEQRDILDITGEGGHRSALHREGTGNAFLMMEDDGSDDESDWVNRQWHLASPVVQALKYVKYGVLDIDYTAVVYTPDWVNWIRRPGIRIGGRPRTEMQDAPYNLTLADQDRLRRYLFLLKKHQALLENFRPTLRQALLTAGEYYEGHHSRSREIDKLIDLVIALEALFGDRGQDLSFRISLCASILLGESPAAIQQIFTFVRRMYAARSDLVHGAENPFTTSKAKKRVSLADIHRLADLVRQAIVRVSVLLVRGDYNRDRASFLAVLPFASFDSALREQLQSRTDIDILLKEEFPNT